MNLAEMLTMFSGVTKNVLTNYYFYILLKSQKACCPARTGCGVGALRIGGRRRLPRAEVRRRRAGRRAGVRRALRRLQAFLLHPRGDGLHELLGGRLLNPRRRLADLPLPSNSLILTCMFL